MVFIPRFGDTYGLHITIRTVFAFDDMMGVVSSPTEISDVVRHSAIPSVYPVKGRTWNDFNLHGLPDNVLRRIFKLLICDSIYQSTYVYEILCLVCIRWKNIIDTIGTNEYKSVRLFKVPNSFVIAKKLPNNKPCSVIFIGPNRYIKEHLIISGPPPRKPSNLPTTRNSHFMRPVKPARMSNNHKGALRTRGPRGCKHR